LKAVWKFWSTVAQAFARAFFAWTYWFESWTIIPLTELVMRAWYRLDPRLYIERFRIKAVTQGELDRKSNQYAILALYSSQPLPNFTANIIAALEASPVNLIVVANSRLEPYLRAQLLQRCNLLIERANLGRDFGGYRDGISVLMRSVRDIDRLVLLNDSLFYCQRGLAKLVEDLCGPHEFIGVTEVFEIHYHVQSYMLSFGPAAVRNRVFRKFWRKYRPISTRRWSVHKGEVRLTRRLTKAGFRPHILHQAAQLIPHLRPRPMREVLEAARLLPQSDRRKLYGEFDRIIGTEDLSVPEFEAISQGIRSNAPGAPPSKAAALAAIGNQLDTMDRWNFEIFSNKLVSIIGSRNQVHAGGFLFMKYLGSPLIKRDIFYRGVYSLEEIYRILSDFNEPLRDEMMSDLRRGGTGANLRGLLRILHSHGSI
jgi:hypothetical protein